MEVWLAEALLLTAVGNASLRGKDVSGFSSLTQFFRGQKPCEFRRARAAGGFDVVAADPEAWFQTLKLGCEGLKLRTGTISHVAMRPSARLVVDAFGSGASLSWEADHRLEGGGWTSVYWARTEQISDAETPVSLEQAAVALRAALLNAAGVADEIDADHFAKMFREAADCLDSTSRDDTWITGDLAMFGDLNDSALRLVAACRGGWQFGTMGAWNDYYIEDADLNARYVKVSEELGEAIFAAATAAANSSYRG